METMANELMLETAMFVGRRGAQPLFRTKMFIIV